MREPSKIASIELFSVHTAVLSQTQNAPRFADGFVMAGQ